MTRFGKVFAGLLALAVLGFLTLVRCSPTAEPEQEAAAPESPSPGAVETLPIAVGPSGLAIPVAGVPALALVNTFDQARGENRVHDAIDIMAPRGTPVLAAADGRVEKLFESELGGHTIYVRSPDGRFVAYYAHLDTYRPGLAEGQAVRQGEAIATVGSTGNASPEAPHLHFEVKAMAPGEAWHEGRALNPYPLLGGR